MAKEDKKLVLTYDKAVSALQNLKTLRGKCLLLSKNQRQDIRVIIDTLEDATRATTTKIGSIQEEYKELRSHKVVLENEEKARKVIKEADSQIKKAQKDFVCPDLDITPVSLKGMFVKNTEDDDDTKNEKIAFWPIYTELEGVFLTEGDDGGEPKKGGGDG